MSYSDAETDDGIETVIEDDEVHHHAMRRRYHEQRIDDKISQMYYQRDQLSTNKSKFKYGITILNEIKIENESEGAVKKQIDDKIVYLNKLITDMEKSLENTRVKIILLVEMKNEIYDSDDE